MFLLPCDLLHSLIHLSTKSSEDYIFTILILQYQCLSAWGFGVLGYGLNQRKNRRLSQFTRKNSASKENIKCIRSHLEIKRIQAKFQSINLESFLFNTVQFIQLSKRFFKLNKSEQKEFNRFPKLNGRIKIRYNKKYKR